MTASEPPEVAENRFGKHLQAVMNDRGISHRKLAKAMGASQQSVTNWTQGHTEPTLRHLRAIAQALGVPPSALLEEERTVTTDSRTATDLVRELAALRQVAPAVETLASSAPDLLDLLARAERHVGEGRRG